MPTAVARRVRLCFDDTTAHPASPGFAYHGFSDEISSQFSRTARQAGPWQRADFVGDMKRILQWNPPNLVPVACFIEKRPSHRSFALRATEWRLRPPQYIVPKCQVSADIIVESIHPRAQGLIEHSAWKEARHYRLIAPRYPCSGLSATISAILSC